MYIAFILSDLKGGGAQKMLINLANWFSAQGHQIDIVLFQKDGIYADLISDSVNIIDLNCKRSLFALLPLRDYIRMQKPNVIFSALYHVNVITTLSHQLTDKTSKLILSERNNILENLNDKSPLLQMMWSHLIKWLYPKAEKIVCISNGVKSTLKQFMRTENNEQFITIYNPVITDHMEQGSSSLSFPATATTKLITSGRLVAQKDYPTLFKAYQLYLETDPNAHLIILGWGALENELKALSKDMGLNPNITFSGFVENPLSIMKQADIFVMTSAWEGFCNVIVEALHCSLNVVATDCVSGPAEILDNGNYGFLSKVGDYKHIAKNIEHAKNTPFDNSALKSRAKDFHVDAIGQKFLNLLEEIQAP